MRWDRDRIKRTAIAAVVCAAALAWMRAPAGAVEQEPNQLQGVGVEEHLGDFIDLDLTFTNRNGEKVALQDFFDGEKPVMLTLNYYTCTALCNLHLNGLAEALRTFDWKPGDQYRIVTISINPKETPELARGKRANYLKKLEKGDDVDWSFLVGEKENIDRLAQQIGFGYRYDPKSDQYAHAALTTFLSPKGKIARYIYGIDLKPQDIKFSLMEASDGEVGSTVDKVLLTCFHYDESEGRYGPYAFGIMRLGAVITLIAVGFLLLVFWRREKRKARAESGGASAA